VYAGHLATGLAIKSVEPRAPTWALIAGVGLLDILFGPFVLLGIERVTLTPDMSPGFSLDYIDWSHSLLMSLVWASGFGLCFLRRGRAVALAVGLAVFSHFLLDLPMHPADLALWPGSAAHVGFGLWQRLPQGWWFVELGVILAALVFYVTRARRSSSFGGHAVTAGLVVVVFHVLNSPWLSAF